MFRVFAMNRHINYYFLGLSSFLLVFGLLFLSTLSAIASLRVFGNTTHYLFHQLMGVGIGLVLGIIAYKTPLRFIKKAVPVIFFINAVTLLIVFLPGVGTKLWGASRWINIGGYTFQPSEFFKISAVAYLALWLSSRFSSTAKKGFLSLVKGGYENARKVFVPFLIFLGIITAVFLLQRDVSTLGIIAIALLVMYFNAGTPLWNTLLIIIVGISGALVVIIREPYRLERLFIFLNPESDPLGMGLQLKQSLIAIGSGGFFGKGLGMSTQKFGFLPTAMSDSVFAIFGEEMGLLGCVILVLLFLLFLYLGYKIANNTTDMFSKLTAIGLTTWIGVQAFINIASSIGMFPLSGIPLPFFSYGGSHIIAELIAVGLLLNISKNG